MSLVDGKLWCPPCGTWHMRIEPDAVEPEDAHIDYYGWATHLCQDGKWRAMSLKASHTVKTGLEYIDIWHCQECGLTWQHTVGLGG